MPAPGVLIAADVSPEFEARLAALSVKVRRPGASQWEVGAESLAECEIAVLRSPYRIQPGAIAQSPQLRLILRAGSGLDGVPLAEAEAAAVEVRTLPLASRSVAEHAFGLLLSAARQQAQMHAALSAGRWLKSQAHGVELCGGALLVVGFGAVGREVARIGQAFGMSLRIFDRSPETPEKRAALAALGAPPCASLEEGLRASDAVVLCCPAQPGGASLLDSRMFALAQRPFLLVNVGRGCLIDEPALIAALDEGRVIGAGLDVQRGEPNPDPALINHPKVVATPHIGAQTAQARTKIETAVLRHIHDACAGVS